MTEIRTGGRPSRCARCQATAFHCCWSPQHQGGRTEDDLDIYVYETGGRGWQCDCWMIFAPWGVEPQTPTRRFQNLQWEAIHISYMTSTKFWHFDPPVLISLCIRKKIWDLSIIPIPPQFGHHMWMSPKREDIKTSMQGSFKWNWWFYILLFLRHWWLYK